MEETNWINLCEIDYDIVSTCDCNTTNGLCDSDCGEMRVAKDKNSDYPNIWWGCEGWEYCISKKTGIEYNVNWVKKYLTYI